MKQRNPAPALAPPDGWAISTEVKLAGHRLALTPGTELTISAPGARGRHFRFIRHVTTDNGATWLDVTDGQRIRSFHPDAVRTIHLKRKIPTRHD